MCAIHQGLASLGQGAQGVGTEWRSQPGPGVSTLMASNRGTRRPWDLGGGTGCWVAQERGGCLDQSVLWKMPRGSSVVPLPLPLGLQGILNPLEEVSQCDGGWQGGGDCG